MLLPPAETVPFTVEILKDPVDWQLLKLENGFKREIGEESLTKIQQKQLQQAVRVGENHILFAKRGYRAVGMCSVAEYYSTFSCSNVGVFEDFYIEPAFRNRGTARKLAEAAQSWCRENDIASLTVCCAACDEAMYQALGLIPALERPSQIWDNKLSRQYAAMLCTACVFYSFSLERDWPLPQFFLSVFSMCV